MQNLQKPSAGGLTRTGENVIAGCIAAALIAAILVIFGYNNTKLWLTSPIVWNEPDDISVDFWSKEEFGDSMELTFNVFNFSNYDCSRYTIYAVYGFNVLELHSSHADSGLYAHDGTWIRMRLDKDDGNKRFFHAVSGKTDAELESAMTFHVKYFSVYGGETYEAAGWVKPVLLLAVAAVCAWLASHVRSQGLRIVLKVLCVPAILAIVVLVLVLKIGGNDSPEVKERVDADMRASAAQRYQRHAREKAGAVMTGRAVDAARAQGQMDKDLADMVAGSKNSHAKQEYQRQASLKAGAAMTGNARDAARAQGRMDELLPELLRDQGKD